MSEQDRLTKIGTLTTRLATLTAEINIVSTQLDALGARAEFEPYNYKRRLKGAVAFGDVRQRPGRLKAEEAQDDEIGRRMVATGETFPEAIAGLAAERGLQ